MRRFGIKPAGRHKMAGQTINELRLDLLESSEISEEQLAERRRRSTSSPSKRASGAGGRNEAGRRSNRPGQKFLVRAIEFRRV